ncbi:hypothetical protein AB1303_14690 [Saccharolobus solfataricus]|uniref:Uncharacterized protein n=1 Tax=Saccharolobus solfataricus TaxID=2287 RepID=A0A7S9ILN5_SACSO|nr:hypothetical protein [Saccharolobus solfataricus]QPG51182.1 hypothetical protein HFC64_16335 [Saccharolobus solfataricus]
MNIVFSQTFIYDVSRYEIQAVKDPNNSVLMIPTTSFPYEENIGSNLGHYECSLTSASTIGNNFTSAFYIQDNPNRVISRRTIIMRGVDIAVSIRNEKAIINNVPLNVPLVSSTTSDIGLSPEEFILIVNYSEQRQFNLMIVNSKYLGRS